MSAPNPAYISVDQIVKSWLLKKRKTIHSYWKVLPLAAEAVQELTLNTLPMVSHKIITKAENETWFRLPSDYTDWVSVGLRQGNMWRPVGVSNRIMPFPNTYCKGQYDSEHNDEFKLRGDWKSWLNTNCSNGTGDFFDGDFWGNDFNDTGDVLVNQQPDTGTLATLGYLFPYWGGYPFFWSDLYDDYGELKGRMYGYGDGYRPDTVTFNVQKGIIMVPDAFPCNQLYLVYVSIGTVDTMTHIDLRAQAAIEAYISWKYAANKRNGLSEAAVLKAEFNEQHKLLRKRLNDLTITTIKRIVMKNYGQTQSIG